MKINQRLNKNSITPEDLSQDVIADYELKKVYVDLPPTEQGP